MGGKESKLRELLKDPHNETMIQEIYQRYDADSNGVLDRKEMRNFAQDLIKVVAQQHGQKVAEFCPDFDGFFNRQMLILDKDRDGKISFSEFKQFVESDSFPV
ncbi:hypothetical protein QOT17_008749 [Balamuthia mandrillaris]